MTLVVDHMTVEQQLPSKETKVHCGGFGNLSDKHRTTNEAPPVPYSI